MRPLLWKELRDLRMWVLAGIALAVAFAALFQSRVGDELAGGYLILFMPLLLTIAAVGLGAGQVARERHLRTLDYLLARPVSPGTVVWMKFLAGTVALAPLVAAFVGLGFIHPGRDSLARTICEQVSFPAMALTLFPRYWFAYAVTLFLSVLVDRSAKVAAAMGVGAIMLWTLVVMFADLMPFSGFVYWLPFVETTGGLVAAAKSASISGLTGVAFGGAAILVAAAAAALLRRSSEPYLGNGRLVALTAGLIGVAVLSAHAASVRLPEVAPAGSVDVPIEKTERSVGVVASNGWAAVILGGGVRFFDFSHPSNPKQVADVRIPLWTSEWYGAKAALADSTVFLVGTRKALPVDQVEIAIVRPAMPVEAIPLWPVRPYDFTSQPVPVDKYLYVGLIHDRKCSIHAFDAASKQEAASLIIDELPPPEPREQERQASLAICRRGSYLYAASPSALTTIDVGNPGRPVVMGRLEFRPKTQVWYTLPRPLAWQDNRLFEIEFWPYSMGSFDLSDPARPVAKAGLTWNGGLSIEGSGRALYRPWQMGVLEFRADGDDLHAQRYLRANGGVSSLAIAGDYLYALSGTDDEKPRKLQAFRLAAGQPDPSIR